MGEKEVFLGTVVSFVLVSGIWCSICSSCWQFLSGERGGLGVMVVWWGKR